MNHNNNTLRSFRERERRVRYKVQVTRQQSSNSPSLGEPKVLLSDHDLLAALDEVAEGAKLISWSTHTRRRRRTTWPRRPFACHSRPHDPRDIRTGRSSRLLTVDEVVRRGQTANHCVLCTHAPESAHKHTANTHNTRPTSRGNRKQSISDQWRSSDNLIQPSMSNARVSPLCRIAHK